MKTHKPNKDTYYFVFESDKEIDEMIRSLKDMKKSKVHHARRIWKEFWLSNGKPTIPEYNKGMR